MKFLQVAQLRELRSFVKKLRNFVLTGGLVTGQHDRVFKRLRASSNAHA